VSDQSYTPDATPPAPAGGVAVQYQKLGHSKAMERLRLAKKARSPYEPTWYLNLAYYQSEQWVAHDGRGLYHPRVRKGQVRLTDNRIRPIVRTEVARLTKQRPGWAATPDGLDDGAINSAQTSTRLLDWAYDHLHFASRRHEATSWARITGAGFVKTVFDPNYSDGVEVMVYPQATPDGQPHPEAGKAVIHPGTGRVLRPGEAPQLDALLEKKAVGGGDACLTVRSPFDIYPDPLATNLEDARWIIDEAVRSPEYVEDTYGVQVKPDAAAMVGIDESGFVSAATTARDPGEHIGIKVYELWEPKSKRVPQGRHVVFTATKVLYEGPNAYSGIPYTMFPGVMMPGRFWPDAVVTDLRPIQARWNKLLSQISENLSKFGNPAMLIDALSNTKVHGVPGEKIKVNFTGGSIPPVSYLAPPQMPGYTAELSAELQGSFREISGQYEIAQGTVPAGVTAASAISLLQEQDATRLGPDVESLENAIGDVGQKVIRIFAEYYTTDHVIAISGEDGLVDVDTWRSSASFRVPRISVVANSTFPRSLAARQAGIRDILNMLLQYGVPISKSAMQKTLKDLQVGGVDNLVASASADVNAAQREWIDFLRGKDPAVNEIDDDHIHIDVHQDSAKVVRWRQLAADRQQVWLNHIMEHRGAAIKKQQQAASMAAIAAGPPPMPGGLPTPGVVPGAPAGNLVIGQPSGNPLPADQQRPPAPPQ
jgi:hypothetical protein